MIKAIDLCCGAGGWAAAAKGLPIEWLAVADIAEDCLETWRVNHAAAHPSCRRMCVDLSTAEGMHQVIEASAGAELVVGGIPCEEVSVSRRGNPASAETMQRWHELIDNALQIVKALGPKWWALEDVIGIEKHLPGPLLFGMDIPKRRIRSELYGPQKRLRTFVGHFPRLARPEPGARTFADVVRAGPYRTLPKIETFRRVTKKTYANGVIRVFPLDRPSFTVTATASRHERTAMVDNGSGPPRVLEWQEAAALQGFPADYVFAASWTRTWKMVGQAIPIYVGRAILQAVAAADAKRRHTATPTAGPLICRPPNPEEVRQLAAEFPEYVKPIQRAEVQP